MPRGSVDTNNFIQRSKALRSVNFNDGVSLPPDNLNRLASYPIDEDDDDMDIAVGPEVIVN